MALKIIWSEFAETQLDEIYEYYEKKASPRIAKKLLKGIINKEVKFSTRLTISQLLCLQFTTNCVVLCKLISGRRNDI